MYEVLDDTAAQVILALESGNSIRRVSQYPHTPYETVRQAVNRLEDAKYVRYDDGLSITDGSVRTAARELVVASAGVSPPSIDETCVIPSSASGRSRSSNSSSNSARVASGTSSSVDMLTAIR